MTPLEKVMDMSIIIREPINVHFPTCNTTEKIPVDFSKLKARTYNVESSIIVFTEDNVLYVIPYIEGIVELLEDEGYVRTDMYVPFTGFCYPAEERHKKKWEALKQLAS